ncbi:MAG: hypothetical protein GY851_02925 [bacterium]|nr:hypothetical protein [bacterium]
MPTWLTGVMASKACPAAVGTPEAVYGALMHSGEAVGDGGPVFKRTFLNLDEPDLCARQLHADWSADLRMSRRESREAVAAGLAALRAFEESQRAAAGKLIGRLERESRVGLVLLARPCMNDPGMNHGIPRALSRLGYPVLTCDSLPTDRAFLASLFDAYETLLRVDDVWKHCYSEHNSRMLWAAKVVARHPNLIGVQLSHFKCGNDAVIEAVLRETVAASGKPFFAFADLDEHPAEGAIRMRIETLAHAVEKYRHRVFGVRACEREPGAARALTTVE